MNDDIAVTGEISGVDGPKVAVREDTRDPRGPGVAEDSGVSESPSGTDNSPASDDVAKDDKIAVAEAIGGSNESPSEIDVSGAENGNDVVGNRGMGVVEGPGNRMVAREEISDPRSPGVDNIVAVSDDGTIGGSESPREADNSAAGEDVGAVGANETPIDSKGEGEDVGNVMDAGVADKKPVVEGKGANGTPADSKGEEEDPGIIEATG